MTAASRNHLILKGFGFIFDQPFHSSAEKKELTWQKTVVMSMFPAHDCTSNSYSQQRKITSPPSKEHESQSNTYLN